MPAAIVLRVVAAGVLAFFDCRLAGASFFVLVYERLPVARAVVLVDVFLVVFLVAFTGASGEGGGESLPNEAERIISRLATKLSLSKEVIDVQNYATERTSGGQNVASNSVGTQCTVRKV